jgi:glycosyltransferase involved in cell wall biosynthesis
VEFCTIVARNYLAGARVLARSLDARLGRRLDVLVIDAVDEERDALRHEPFRVLLPSDIGLDRTEFHTMATIYDVTELATAVKPFLLRTLVDASAGPVCYLDPDIVVFTDLGDLDELLARHDVVLTPHMTQPLDPDGGLPDETVMLQTGSYNLGFVAVSARARPMLDWWADRLRRECRVRPNEGRFVDQRWMDLVPSYFDAAIWKDPGCNVAYWNLHERDVVRGPRGFEVNGSPLRFFHFSGFSPLHPTEVSKYILGPPRRSFADSPALARLFRDYRAALLDAGYLDAMQVPYRYGYTAAGIPIDKFMRDTARHAVLRHDADPASPPPPDPFDGVAAREFVDWLRAVDPRPRFPLTRYEIVLWEDVDKFRHLFPHPDETPDEYRDHLARFAPAEGATRVALPPPRRRPGSGRDAETRPQGVNVVGYLDAQDGVGAVGRALIDTLRAADIPYTTVVSGDTGSRRGAHFAQSRDKAVYDLTVACINADEMPYAADRLGDDLHVAGPVAGIWAWEVEHFPEWMGASETLVDEVWTYSEHSAAAIRGAVSCPVAVFPPPIAPAEPIPLSRSELHLPEGYLFLFCFDANSVFERKNPEAVVRAFRAAFPAGSGPQLVVKVVNADPHGLDLALLRRAAADRPDITIRTYGEPPERQIALMAAADAYVSLHRAEGYGLTMAEAMLLGKPVIATAYSGNLEFMDEANSILVPYTKVPIPVGLRPYPAGTMWANPDVDAATVAMQRLASDPAAGVALGARARTDVLAHHAPERRVEELRRRLVHLRGLR